MPSGGRGQGEGARPPGFGEGGFAAVVDRDHQADGYRPMGTPAGPGRGPSSSSISAMMPESSSSRAWWLVTASGICAVCLAGGRGRVARARVVRGGRARGFAVLDGPIRRACRAAARPRWARPGRERNDRSFHHQAQLSLCDHRPAGWLDDHSLCAALRHTLAAESWRAQSRSAIVGMVDPAHPQVGDQDAGHQQRVEGSPPPAPA
jgi:hypothetical protein